MSESEASERVDMLIMDWNFYVFVIYEVIWEKESDWGKCGLWYVIENIFGKFRWYYKEMYLLIFTVKLENIVLILGVLE